MKENLGDDCALRVPVVVVLGNGDIPVPEYMSPGAAGMDLRAAVVDDVVLEPGGRELVGTGLRIALPDGYEGQVRPRSGMAVRDGVTVLNAPGTIDPDYRGEIKVILANLGQAPVTIRRGDRIAQLVVAPVVRVSWHICDSLPGTSRGRDGFGHTGKE